MHFDIVIGRMGVLFLDVHLGEISLSKCDQRVHDYAIFSQYDPLAEAARDHVR